MSQFRKLFVVIDPTTDTQLALQNAEWIAAGNQDVSIHVYECIYSASDSADPDALRRVELARHRAWVDAMVKPLIDKDLNVTVEIEWANEWRDALSPAASRAEADLIIKAASVHSGAERRFLKTSDWTLLRNAPCPVYLIKKDNIGDELKVLVALDIKAKDDLHNTLNKRVIQFGQELKDSQTGGSLYAVNAYSDANKYVYPDDLAEQTGIDPLHAHSVEGPAESVIPEVAHAISADVLVIGTAGRDGFKAAVTGNTAEKVLDAVHTNILTVTAG
ncbi:MAG: universal stress protein [Pseudomonadales bacterium]|nr:universal stress protein [Pseudomonadales bacterium]